MCKHWLKQVLLLSALCFAKSVHSQTDAAQQFMQLQAAWIYNIARFIDYPAEQKSAPLSICIQGQEAEAIAALLGQGVKGRLIQQRVIDVRVSTDIDVAGCHLVYFAGARPDHSELAKASSKPLIIAGPNQRIDDEALFNLRLQGNKLELYLNKQVLKDSHVSINPSLLRLARPLEALK